MPTIREWRQRLQPAAEFDAEPYVHHVIRPFSIYITLALGRTPITPNQVTAISMALEFVAATLWAVGGVANFIIGGVLCQIAHLLDAVDGELARYKNMASQRGVFLDLMGHYLTDYAMIVGAGLGLAREFGDAVLYAALIIAPFHFGDELLRDLLFKVRFKAGADQPVQFKGMDRAFSFRKERAASLAFVVLGFLVTSTGFFTGMLVSALVDAASYTVLMKRLLTTGWARLVFLIAWGGLTALKFAVRFYRMYTRAFEIQ